MYVYIHVPFCRSRCIYCDFYVVLEKYGGQECFVETLKCEIRQRFADYRQAGGELTPIQTVYVGGGTPSLLSAEVYRDIFECLEEASGQPFDASAEVTLEANPGAMHSSTSAYREAGFNRMSVGVQSLNDQELKALTRLHTAEEVKTFINKLKQGGFANISVDLMYALPKQTMESWQETLEQVTALDVQHISMYGLKVEEKTPLEKLIDVGAYRVPDDSVNVEMYFEGLNTLESVGFTQYEISNLAQPGYPSKHNVNYWNNAEFFAFGPSAHGYVAERRYANTANLAQWLDDPLGGESYRLTAQETCENALIFGLRKREGVHIPTFETQYQINFKETYGWILKKYKNTPVFEPLSTGYLRLQRDIIPVSNSVLSDFLSLSKG